MATLEERLAKHGFTVAQLGGGCEGWERTDGTVVERILDDVGGYVEPTRPQELSDSVAICSGTVMQDEDDGELPVTFGYTLADVLGALEHPSEFPVLLTSRLQMWRAQ